MKSSAGRRTDASGRFTAEEVRTGGLGAGLFDFASDEYLQPITSIEGVMGDGVVGGSVKSIYRISIYTIVI